MLCHINGCHNTQHNDIQHNNRKKCNTQHSDTRHNGTWHSVLLYWVSQIMHHAVCCYAECNSPLYADCRDASFSLVKIYQILQSTYLNMNWKQGDQIGQILPFGLLFNGGKWYLMKMFSHFFGLATVLATFPQFGQVFFQSSDRPDWKHTFILFD